MSEDKKAGVLLGPVKLGPTGLPRVFLVDKLGHPALSATEIINLPVIADIHRPAPGLNFFSTK